MPTRRAGCQALLAALLACLAIPWPGRLRAAPLRQRQQAIRQLIEQAAHTAVAGPVQVELGSLQAVAAMAPCRKPPRVQLDGQGRYRDARVSCPDQGWQIYVAVTIRRHRKVIVAAHDLAAGEVLHRNDVMAASDTAPANGVAHSLSAVVGHVLVAPVSAGTPIALSQLRSAVTVHAGQTITVHVTSGRVRVVTTAIALQDGRIGQSILVKNPESGHRYRVTITAGGAVDDLGG